MVFYREHISIQDQYHEEGYEWIKCFFDMFALLLKEPKGRSCCASFQS